MSLHKNFLANLEHFASTVTIKTLDGAAGDPKLCGLRHDVDHSIDVALEMASFEHRHGFQATYFLLPSAAYWTDPKLIDKALQLQDYGHEVGLHLNVLAQWFNNDIDNPASALDRQLELLRSGGVEISGISSHGDKLCYANNFINYWLFEELKPSNPEISESGRTAEGIRSNDPRQIISYPDNHVLSRRDGAQIELWSLQMEDFGLDYEAWHVPHDRYFSDSGGGWRRTPDPLGVERGDDRWQVLIHPIHWQGDKKKYFFLSTARSGSTWLTEVLKRATPLEARHEFMLNHDYSAGRTGHKNTSTFAALQKNPTTVRELLLEAWEVVDELPGDYAEVNVYLASFLHEVKSIFPDATFVHLKRNPRDVVSSLMNRNWFDTVPDPAHPVTWDEGATPATQFERVCHYVHSTQSFLELNADFVLDFERLSASVEDLAEGMSKVDIPVHPRLAAALIGEIINANTQSNFPAPSDWNKTQHQVFDLVFGGIKANPQTKVLEFEREDLPISMNRMKARNAIVSLHEGLVSFTVSSPLAHASLTLGGSEWSARGVSNHPGLSGWELSAGGYLTGMISAETIVEGSVAIYGLSFDVKGLLSAKKIGALTRHMTKAEFSFSPHPLALSADIALYVPAGEPVAGMRFLPPEISRVSIRA